LDGRFVQGSLYLCLFSRKLQQDLAAG
jgi:hypothetical protein